MWTALAANLAAQGSDQGFRWVGIRAGSLSFDPQENVKAATSLGGQGGMVFDQQRYGLSLEGFLSHPKSNFAPDKSLTHSELSVTLMTGLSGDPTSKWWPYLGLGLGGVSVPKIDPATLVLETTKGGAAHVSLGFLHRSALGLIWGLEGRYLLTFTPKDLRELQGSAMVGFTWGGKSAPRPAVAEIPEPKATLPPPIPLPIVEAAPLPPAQPPVVVVIPPPPPPAPAPPPVVAPVPLAIGPVKGAKVAEDGALVFSGKSLNFASNSATISAVGKDVLASLEKALRAIKVPYWLQIDGHTSSSGTVDTNMRLSLLRSKGVATALTALGIPSERMLTRGFGPTKPVASNDTKAGQLMNRRVEVRVFPGDRPAALSDATPKNMPDQSPKAGRSEGSASAALPPPASLPVVIVATPPPSTGPTTRAGSAPSTTGGGTTLTARLDALRLGDMDKALDLGRKRIAAIPAHHWTIRLEIADLPATLKNAVVAFRGGEPDLFIAPIQLRGGKTSYQLFLGDYPSKAEAERAAKVVPSFFLEGGQRPKPFLGTGIPSR
jgi:outer membrane protein OmpA-like peptidoglycan-associated protein